MPSSNQPALGSLAIYSPSPNPQVINITASTCYNLSLFKDLMKEYRKLDDSVTMRINRTMAQFRDRDRSLTSQASQEEACAYFWRQMVDNWQRRSQVIEYCVDVMSKAIDDKKAVKAASEPGSRPRDFSMEETMRRQIQNEQTVEKIIQQRSLDAFKNRCKYFEPPASDEPRKWWDGASSR